MSWGFCWLTAAGRLGAGWTGLDAVWWLAVVVVKGCDRAGGVLVVCTWSWSCGVVLWLVLAVSVWSCSRGVVVVSRRRVVIV